MNIILVCGIIIVALFVGFFLGRLIVKIKLWLDNKNEAIKVRNILCGKENNILILPSGEIYDFKGIPSLPKQLELSYPPLPTDNLPKLPTEEKLSYKDDLGMFKATNKELERYKKEYEEGKLTYTQLKSKFEYSQNQPYYKRIIENYWGQSTE